MSTEADIEDAFAKYAESLGCEALKLRIDGQNGFPDRTVLIPGGKVAFFELKRPGGKLRPMQRFWIQVLRKLGHSAYSPNSFESAKKALDRELSR